MPINLTGSDSAEFLLARDQIKWRTVEDGADLQARAR